jgi:hypothetical protein
MASDFAGGDNRPAGQPLAYFHAACGVALLIGLPMLWVVGVRDAIVYSVMVSSVLVANAVVFAFASRRTVPEMVSRGLSAAAFVVYLALIAALYLAPA